MIRRVSGLAVVFGLAACAAPSLAGDIYVPDDYTTIQDAVDAAGSGDVIHIAAGTYEEQVVIATGNLTLVGVGSGDDEGSNTIIKAPVSMAWFFGTNYPIVGINGVTGVSLEAIRVDGAGRGNGNYRFVGIAFWNGGGDVDGCVVTDVRDTPFSGAQHGVGIYAYNDTGGTYTVNVTGTTVVNYQKNAFALSGDGLTANVTGCTTTGYGATAVTAQNGIQISYGAGGTIDDCTVTGNIYTGGSWAASGLLLDSASNVEVKDTVVTDNLPGVYCQDTPSATFTRVTVSNDDAQAGDGMYVRNWIGAALGPHVGTRPVAVPFEEPGSVPSGRHAVVDVSISDSEFLGTDTVDSMGVYADAGVVDAVNVTMTDCLVKDWDYGIIAADAGAPANVSANYCSIVSNMTYGFYADAFAKGDQDAEDNWWGADSGPYHPTANPSGQGDAVSDNVDFDPYATSAADLDLNTLDDWCGDEALVEVTIDMSDAGDYVVGGQFFLTYDTNRLDFQSAVAGDPPFTREIYEVVNEGAGTIDYAVGVPDGGSGTMEDKTMAVLTFKTNDEACAVEGLVAFRTHDPPTRLSSEYGDPISVATTNLPEQTIDYTKPTVSSYPPDVLDQPADAGVCTYDASWTAAGVSDNCDPDPTVEYGIDLDNNGSVDATITGTAYTFPVGYHKVTVVVTDYCGNVNDDNFFIVEVTAYNELVVDVELSPTMVAGPLTRCITFELWDCTTSTSVTVEKTLTFNNGLASAVLDSVPCGFYDCITARDTLHTLRSTDDDDFIISGTQYVAEFLDDNVVPPGHDDWDPALSDWLIGGNLNDDKWIDILDFGVFTWQWMVNYGTGDTNCSTPYPHADINGDGVVNTFDFTFIQINYLLGHEANCCGMPGYPLMGGPFADSQSDGPVTRISVRELKRRGLGHLAVGDLSGDGWLDEVDMVLFIQGVSP